MDETSSLSAQVYCTVKDRIKSLEYQPGAMLKERELSESLGVSRTPIREAIQRLMQEAWLVPGDGKRLQIRPITKKDVYEIIEIRNLVEYAALDSIVKNNRSRVLAGMLDSLLNEMKSCKDDTRLTAVDLKFHHLLVGHMGNSRITKFWETVQDEIYRMGLMVLRGNNRWPQVISEHEDFVDTLWSKDSEKMKAALKVHLEHSYSSILLNLKEHISDNQPN